MFLFNWSIINKMFHQLVEDIKTNNFAILEEMHHLSSGMKALFT